MGYILEGVNLVPRLSCMGTVWYILFACSVPPGDLVMFIVKHIHANLKSEIALHNCVDLFLTLQCDHLCSR